jgi:hypothetical protein
MNTLEDLQKEELRLKQALHKVNDELECLPADSKAGYDRLLEKVCSIMAGLNETISRQIEIYNKRAAEAGGKAAKAMTDGLHKTLENPDRH